MLARASTAPYNRRVHVLALTVGNARVASTQYRLAQFAGSLQRAGVTLTLQEAKGFRAFSTLGDYDLVIVQKRLMRTSWVKRIRKASKALIFDTDDAIWEPHGRRHFWWTRFRTRQRLRAIVRAADACTVPNEHLAQFLRSFARHVEVVPMALDPAEWRPAAETPHGPVRIGWAGAPPNLLYLSRLSGVLEEVQRQRPGVEIIVYCGEAPVWTAAVRATHHPYQPGTEPAVVRTFDIGLLPLPDDAFAAGKSPIKALQYAACGVACVASPVGATREIVQHGITGMTAATADEWREALLRLIDDASLRKTLAQAATERFLRFHARASVETQLLACWKRVVSSR